MSLNTLEGWNAYVKEGHSQILREQGIEPAEENPQKFQEEVNALADSLQEKAEKKQRKEQLVGELCESAIDREVEEILKIAGHMAVSFPPYEVIDEVYNSTIKKSGSHTYFALANVWLAGYIHGKRAERKRRNRKSPAVAATTSGAEEK